VKKFGVVFLILFSAGLFSGEGWAARENIIIAVQPTSTAEKLSSEAKEIERYLEEKTGTDVDILFPTSYAGVVEALRFGHAQAAFMGAWPAALAKKHAGAEVALAEVREVIIDDRKTDAPYYFSHWVVLKESPYGKLEELKARKAAFPSPLSTSGYVAPLSRLVDLGLVKPAVDKPADPKEFFGAAVFSGGYAQCWEALKSGQADISVIAGDVPEKLYREVLDNTRVLETQGPVPSHAVVLSKGLPEPLKTKLTEALLGLGEPDKRGLMRKFISGIFVRFERADDRHLASLDEMVRKTGLRFEEKK
jgi:phosphonate transport system substrate-binding protein